MKLTPLADAGVSGFVVVSVYECLCVSVFV